MTSAPAAWALCLHCGGVSTARAHRPRAVAPGSSSGCVRVINRLRGVTAETGPTSCTNQKDRRLPVSRRKILERTRFGPRRFSCCEDFPYRSLVSAASRRRPSAAIKQGAGSCAARDPEGPPWEPRPAPRTPRTRRPRRPHLALQGPSLQSELREGPGRLPRRPGARARGREHGGRARGGGARGRAGARTAGDHVLLGPRGRAGAGGRAEERLHPRFGASPPRGGSAGAGARRGG